MNKLATISITYNERNLLIIVGLDELREILTRLKNNTVDNKSDISIDLFLSGLNLT